MFYLAKLFAALVSGLVLIQEEHLYYVRYPTTVTGQTIPCATGVPCPVESCRAFRYGSLSPFRASSCFCNTTPVWPCPGKYYMLSALVPNGGEFFDLTDLSSFLGNATHLVGPVGSLYLEFDSSSFWVFDSGGSVSTDLDSYGCCPQNAGFAAEYNGTGPFVDLPNGWVLDTWFLSRNWSVFNSVLLPSEAEDFDEVCPQLTTRLALPPGTHGWIVSDRDPGVVMIVRGYRAEVSGDGGVWLPYFQSDGEYNAVTEIWFLSRWANHCNPPTATPVNCNGMGCAPTGRGYYVWLTADCPTDVHDPFAFCNVVSSEYEYHLYLRIEWDSSWQSDGPAFFEVIASELVEIQQILAGLGSSSDTFDPPDKQEFQDEAEALFPGMSDFLDGDPTGVFQGDQLPGVKGYTSFLSSALVALDMTSPTNFRVELPLGFLNESLGGIYFDWGDAAGSIHSYIGSTFTTAFRWLLTLQVCWVSFWAQLRWLMWGLGWAQVQINSEGGLL